MIVDEEFLSKLRRSFGLNLYEVKLWTALLSRGISTAGELSDMADVPRSRTYDVLESLERKGFVIVKPEKPIKYIAISPQEVLDRVKKRIEELAANRSMRLDKLKESDILSELEQLYERGIEPMNPTDFSGALKGRHNIYDHLALLIKEANESISIMTSGDGLIRKIRALKPVLEKAVSRGVSIRIAAPIEGEAKEFAEKSAIGEIRDVKDIKARFCVVDKKQMIFMLLDDVDTHPTYDLAMWISTPYFASAMQAMFDTAWNNGNAIGTGKTAAPATEIADASEN